MKYENLIVEENGNTTLIRMNNPKTMNAISPAMAAELRGALRHAATVSNAVILTGDDRAFCSGANLSNSSGMVPGKMDTGAMLEDVYNPLVMTIRDLPIPLITAIRGSAAGIGASLAMLGDIIVGGKSSYFLIPFPAPAPAR